VLQNVAAYCSVLQHVSTLQRVAACCTMSQHARPTQSIMYVPLQVNMFLKSILLIVQYKYLKSCSGDFILQNLILRTLSRGTGFITQSSWVFYFLQTTLDGNFLYHICTSFERASRGGQPLNIFT